MTEERPPLCPICGDDAPDLYYQITRFQVLRCRSCTQIYLYPLLSPEEIRRMFAQLYTSGEGSVPELKSYYAYCYDDEPGNPLVQLYESWLDEIEKHHPPGRLLDVGCGTGLFLSAARRRGWEPFGIDDSEEATQYARDHFGLDVWVGDFKDFHAAGRRFDVISGWDILEHARKPLEVLEAMRTCLAPSGVVALSTPNQRNILDLVAGGLYRLTGGRATGYLEKFYIEQHFLYYTPKTLAAALERAGFEVARMAREGTDLRRLSLSPFMRLSLQSLFLVARLTGLETRLFVIGRPRSA
ncbi:MAG: class I SAM-dependent methyltransferase [Myxococcota bacterium]|nr:class I SAM-dependent methyltransferase [Myxococcota bacterium]